MGLAPEIRRVAPRALYALLMPRGPIDPREAPSRPGSPIAPPFPDILIASGRRAIPYVRAVRQASGGRTFTIVLKDPRTGTGAADLIWVQEHDRLRGSNVVATLLAPHRVSATRLAEARTNPDPRLSTLAEPRVAILVGGNSRHHRFTPIDIDRFALGLRRIADEGASLAVTTSRRTPQGLLEALRLIAAPPRHFLWDGSGPADRNPYLALLAQADAIVATADSTNMIGEAVATGSPVLVFEPSGGHPKIARYLDGLVVHGAVRRFDGRLEDYAYQPLDDTPEIAAEAHSAYARHLAAVQSGRPER
jgi:mitochondrial fission protein ELM1